MAKLSGYINKFIIMRPKPTDRIVHSDEMDNFIAYVYDFGLFFVASSMLFLTFVIENLIKMA